MTIDDQGLKARAVKLLAAQIPSAWDISDSTKPCDVTAAQALRAIEAALSSTPSPSLTSREAIALADELKRLLALRDEVHHISIPGDPAYTMQEGERVQASAYRAKWFEANADAILSLLPVNGVEERVCSVCTAVVAASPEAMCCHCCEMSWPIRALSAAPGEGAGG